MNDAPCAFRFSSSDQETPTSVLVKDGAKCMSSYRNRMKTPEVVHTVTSVSTKYVHMNPSIPAPSACHVISLYPI